MPRYVAQRVLSLVPVWLGISILAFGLSLAAPGDPVRQTLQQQGIDAPSAEQVGAMRRELGLDQPPPVRYVRWLGDALRGDLGRSYRTGEPVLQSLIDRFPRTAELAITAVLLGLVLALPLGVLAALHRGGALDHASRIAALLGASMPSFWLAYLLIIAFAVQLRLLPVAGMWSTTHTAAGRSPGRPPTTARSASTPPADAPIPITHRGRGDGKGEMSSATCETRAAMRAPS